MEEKTDSLSAIEEKLQTLTAENAELKEKIAELDKKLSANGQPSSALSIEDLRKQIVEIVSSLNTPQSKPTSEFCKVSTCKEKSRARGFCAKHYQKWRRGTLPGFVPLGGKLNLEGKTFQFDESLEGEPYQVVDGKVIVNGQTFES